jgi:hypothetical protein
MLPALGDKTLNLRRPMAAGISTRISCHIFCGTGITTYPRNGGKLEVAKQWLVTSPPVQAAYYDPRNDAFEFDEGERVVY